MNYKIVYDILSSGSGVEDEMLGFAIGIGIGVLFLVGSFIIRRRFAFIFSIIWLVGFAGCGALGFGNVYYQHYRCVQWARSGDYQTIEGVVTDYVEHIDRPIYEQFSVKGVTFNYSSYDLSVCGFRQMAFDGGPIKEGLHVRIAYREGRILKLELANSPSSE